MTSQTKRALKWDLLRSIPLGFIQSLSSTFGVLILIRVFEGGQLPKAWVVASQPIGLLTSLFILQVIRHRKVEARRAMFWLYLLSAFGFGMIATARNNSSLIYVTGILLGSIGIASVLPLMSEIYKKSFPTEIRGKLFSYGGFIQKCFAIVAAVTGGWLLKANLQNYKILFLMFSGCCLSMAWIVTRFDRLETDPNNKVRLFSAFRHIKNDKEFRHLLSSWMILGTGNLLCLALFVEYISNRSYGYDLDEFTIGLITTFVPEAMYLLVIIGWGKLFDKWNIYLLRAFINIFLFLGILVFFLGHGIPFLVIGIALHGIGKAGGNVAWSLWVTKLAKPEHVAQYMSVHSFLTGCRGLIAPFISLPLVLLISPKWIAVIGATLILIATLMVAPQIRLRTKRREGQVIDIDPR